MTAGSIRETLTAAALLVALATNPVQADIELKGVRQLPVEVFTIQYYSFRDGLLQGIKIAGMGARDFSGFLIAAYLDSCVRGMFGPDSDPEEMRTKVLAAAYDQPDEKLSSWYLTYTLTRCGAPEDAVKSWARGNLEETKRLYVENFPGRTDHAGYTIE